MGFGDLMRILFHISSGFLYHARKNPSCLGKLDLVSIWFRMVLTQLITWVYVQGFTDLDSSIEYQYMDVVTILIPLLMLIIDNMHSTYHTIPTLLTTTRRAYVTVSF